MPTVEPVDPAFLIADLKCLQLYRDQPITRSFYLSHGSYLESEYLQHFDTFNSFLAAAGLKRPSMWQIVLDWFDEKVGSIETNNPRYP